ncbi:hypothetical phage protein [Campylobacter phage CPt10]|nr:hypothetical protein APL46_gp111 [Campylobacter phage CPt10]CBJ94313.1 hypothetical phage protein [Campylobacter phage CPt10]
MTTFKIYKKYLKLQLNLSLLLYNYINLNQKEIQMLQDKVLKNYRDSLNQRLSILIRDPENNKDVISDVKVEIKKIDNILNRSYNRG